MINSTYTIINPYNNITYTLSWWYFWSLYFYTFKNYFTSATVG